MAAWDMVSAAKTAIGGDRKGTEKGDRTKRPNVHGTYGNIIASSKISTNTGRYDIG